MTMCRLQEIAAMSGGRLAGPDVEIAAVGSDTRSLAPGELFVALRGPRFDGHDFVAAPGFQGAAALVDHEIAGNLPQVVVDDTLAALGRLAAAWRRRMSARVVALTGSSGKTTVKEMIAAILREQGPTLATRGNLNNEIGVPLTLLGLRPVHRFAVVEMGANHPREIDALTQIASPDVALVNNAGPAHLEGFGGIEGVARAKGEIYGGLGPAGTAVVNADDPFADYWRGLNAGRRVLSFGMAAEDADYRGRLDGGALDVTAPDGEQRIGLPLPGRHNAMNALAACAAVGALGVGIDAAAAALVGMTPVAGRLMPRAGIRGAHILDDTYNANPASTAAAIEVLAAEPGERWLALGDMGELGPSGPQLHRETGECARAAGLERLYTTGVLAAEAAKGFGPEARHFESRDALVETLERDLHEGVTLLVKGSRASRMERVVDALLLREPGQEGESHAARAG